MEDSLLDSSAAKSVSSMEEGTISSEGVEANSMAAHQGDSKNKTPAEKKRRNSGRKPRNKGLLKKLQDQIEFYFGDANLPKDKFLLQTMKENEGYVPVEVVASFKKMQSLSKDLHLIQKAIKNSSMLELSQDSEMLRRLSPLLSPEDSKVDLRTVYVENLVPGSTDHETVKKIFKPFGEVTFVSLPRHKFSGEVKGFAFVEFSSQESATKAVEYFKDKNTPQPNQKPSGKDTITDGEVGAVGKDGEGGAPMEANAAGTGADGSEAEAGAMETEDNGTDLNEADTGETGAHSRDKEAEARDHTRSTKDGTRDMDASTEALSGDKKTDAAEAGAKTTVAGANAIEMGKALSMEGGEGEDKRRGKTEDPPSEVTRRGKKRVRASKKGGSETCEDRIEVSDPKIPPAKRPKKGTETAADVIQEENSAQSKAEEEGAASNNGGEKKEGGSKKKRNRQHRKKQWSATMKDLDIKVMSKTEWLKLKESFKSIQKSHMQQVKSLTKSAPSAPQTKGFVKDCLVRVELEQEKRVESQTDQLQEYSKQFGEVAYVDLKDGEEIGYVRFKSSGCVGGLLESDTKPAGCTFSAVNEIDERAYFIKTQAERKQWFARGGKKINQRGQDKLINRVLKKNVRRYNDEEKSPPVVGKVIEQPTLPKSTLPKSTHIKFTSDSEDECS